MEILNPSFIRRYSPTNIRYILLSGEIETFSFILPPQEFDNYVIEFIANCPRDLMQLVNPVNFYELSYRYAFNNAFHFSIIYDRNIEKFADDLTELNEVRLFFLDGKSDRFRDTLDFLRRTHRPTHFYLIFGDKNKAVVGIENAVDSPGNFIQALVSNQTDIFKTLDFGPFQLTPFVNAEYKHLVSPNSFAATNGNYRMINNVIGNFPMDNYKRDDSLSQREVQQLAEDSQKAKVGMDSFERQILFVNQVNTLDTFVHYGLNEGIFKLKNGTEAFLPSLILIAPYHNPDIKSKYETDDLAVRAFLKASAVEQTRNYTVAPAVKLDPSALLLAMKNQKSVLSYLDNVSFLHASYNFSPVIRLPLKGASINRELSFFRTNNFFTLANIKARRSLVKNIEQFGSIYKHKCIAPEVEELISDRNGQVVLISDLPLEWLTFEKVPFAFSHDICRLPVVGYRSLMANYAASLVVDYQVPIDIAKNTLVIYGNSEPAFRVWQDECDELAKQKGFKTVRCSSVEGVNEAVKTHRPDFLIFDCHGGYDKNTNSTYLMIGSEMLTGETVVENGISAHLVFLSACGTAPTYGAINTIANAFLQMGSLAVTTTYLPVEVNRSSILYLRLLNKLEVAASEGLHKNWLEFVAHITRTEFIMSRYQLALRKSPPERHSDLLAETTRLLTKTLSFFDRRSIYAEITRIFAANIGRDEKIFDNLVPEYLFYSHLGRADLILFSKWLEDYRKKNGMEQQTNPAGH